jgi:uncharacterized protein YndB with AHSA1/START domain
MRHDLIVSQSVIINTYASKVWNALTNPEQIKKYLFGTEAITDWQKGSKVVFQGEYNGLKYEDKGLVLESIINEKLVYTYWSGFYGLEDKSENYSMITYSIIELSSNQCSFTWSQKGFATEEGYNHSLSGMEELLKTIKTIAEQDK